jgi:hypothetical protein
MVSADLREPGQARSQVPASGAGFRGGRGVHIHPPHFLHISGYRHPARKRKNGASPSRLSLTNT